MSDTYAVIALQGKQFLVRENEKLIVDSLPEKEEGDKITINDVLLVKTSKETLIGKPILANASVDLEIIKNQKADKIIVFKYKSKSRYRRKRGHRQHQTVLMVTSIKLK
jgi:large subunit ribosomal protein L21